MCASLCHELPFTLAAARLAGGLQSVAVGRGIAGINLVGHWPAWPMCIAEHCQWLASAAIRVAFLHSE